MSSDSDGIDDVTGSDESTDETYHSGGSSSCSTGESSEGREPRKAAPALVLPMRPAAQLAQERLAAKRKKRTAEDATRRAGRKRSAASMDDKSSSSSREMLTQRQAPRKEKVQRTTMSHAEMEQVEQAPSVAQEYKMQQAKVAEWRRRAQEEVEAWKEAEEARRMQDLESGAATAAWVMPRSGQPLPQRVRRGGTEAAVTRKQTLLEATLSRWESLKADNPEMEEELRRHLTSSDAYLPRQELMNAAAHARAAEEAAAMQDHEQKQLAAARRAAR
eukprot:TRINITY_DN33064_c0_g1_i1.p1 TRINITY_DN33064_c0_g1~~TRINITY_DN33064_c0_g1_i1.p1  ORF type:complete len:275 (+),score=81.05 TRINITY_DN33064_c0_g1_i1:60-884(+)